MKKYYLLFIFIFLAACSAQQKDVAVEPATNTLEPTSTFTTEPSDTPQPTDTVELLTATATRPPTLTPAFEIGTIMTNEMDGASMVYIPPGEFMMGDDEGSPGQQPAHLVSTLGFWMYQYEVTNAQYLQCIAAGVCKELEISGFSNEKTPNELVEQEEYADFPVMWVTWKKAKTYCEWAGGRLPTEAEWEMAARGGLEGMSYPWGNEEPVCDLGAVNGAHFNNCEDTFGVDTLPVGSFAPNGYGLYDMVGNIAEWVFDYYDEDYYKLLIYENPKGPGLAQYRVARGGDFRIDAIGITVAWRSAGLINLAHPIGVRCVVSP